MQLKYQRPESISQSRPKMGMIDDIMKGAYKHTKRRALDEKVGGFGCWGPAMRQRTDNESRVYRLQQTKVSVENLAATKSHGSLNLRIQM